MTKENVINKVDLLENIFEKRPTYFMFNHTYDISPRPVYMKTHLGYDTVDLLAAYLQLKADEMEHAYSLDQVDMVNLMVKHFDCEILDSEPEDYYHLDLYENWEWWCGVADQVEAIHHFNKEELIADLVELVNKGGN
jgi:hypothetical protein